MWRYSLRNVFFSLKSDRPSLPPSPHLKLAFIQTSSDGQSSSFLPISMRRWDRSPFLYRVAVWEYSCLSTKPPNLYIIPHSLLCIISLPSLQQPLDKEFWLKKSNIERGFSLHFNYRWNENPSEYKFPLHDQLLLVPLSLSLAGDREDSILGVNRNRGGRITLLVGKQNIIVIA